MDMENFLLMVLGVLLGTALTGAFFSGSYQQGQTDCIQGYIKYELVKQPNGETKWEPKE